LKLGPTSANSSPVRFLFVKSREAKERLKPHLSEGNVAKTTAAPVTIIIGYDLDFYEHLPKLFPHTNAKSWCEAKDEGIFETAFTNVKSKFLRSLGYGDASVLFPRSPCFGFDEMARII
jgi:3-hydroxypropanoate dehydrogenase